jgi:Ca-activated chloride channel homolog
MRPSIADRHRRRAAAGGTVLLLAAGAASLPAADVAARRPSFSSAVDMVKLNVSVTDAADRCLTGFLATDFNVLEDGVAQQVSLFTQERLPITLAILIDNSTSMENSLPAAKRAALRLLQALQEGDEAEVAQFNHRLSVLQDFTADQARLETAVVGIRASGDTGLYDALYLTLKDRRFRERSDRLGRRAIVILSDGEDTSSLVGDEQVLELARRSDVAVITIGLRVASPVTLGPFRTEAFDRATFFLKAMARETGGRSYFPTRLSQLDGVYDKIADELRMQYVLGYVSSNPVRDGQYRKIAIRVAQESVLLRHRPGYYALPTSGAETEGAGARPTSRRPPDR